MVRGRARGGRGKAHGLAGVGLALAVALGAAPIAAATAPQASIGPPGTGLAWGDNAFGQLGNGTATDSTTPVPVTPPAHTRITAVAAGSTHSVALTSTGKLLAWGSNFYGELGNGTTTPSATAVPVALPVNTRITAISVNYGHNLALTSTGRVLAWGYNAFGQLGNGTTANSTTPVPVALPANTRITGISASYLHSLALTSVGRMLAWGANFSGQLGNEWCAS